MFINEILNNSYQVLILNSYQNQFCLIKYLMAVSLTASAENPTGCFGKVSKKCRVEIEF